MINFDDFRGVIFDLDGVITDTAKYHFWGWRQLAYELQIEFTETDNEKLKGVDRLGSLDYILNLAGYVVSDQERLALASRKNDYYRNMIASISKDDLLPGVETLIENLKVKGKKIAVASASQNARAILKSLELDEQFDHIADASLARSKPQPDIFLFAAYGMGLHPTVCVGIEDSLAGLEGIKSASMYALGVGGSELGDAADALVPSLEDVA